MAAVGCWGTTRPRGLLPSDSDSSSLLRREGLSCSLLDFVICDSDQHTLPVSHRVTSLPSNRLTHERTPPTRPSAYPVIKSFDVGAGVPPGVVGGMSTLSLERFPAAAALRSPFWMYEVRAAGAGDWGREAGQYWRSSRESSWPVVDQFVRMLSRSSWTWRLRSSSFFLSQLTLSSWRGVPRLNWRAMYFS